jgi:hypothetical protein
MARPPPEVEMGGEGEGSRGTSLAEPVILLELLPCGLEAADADGVAASTVAGQQPAFAAKLEKVKPA